ncbi:MAG: ECF transporter S component [Clostridia bacterium]|nr:ECF transporter S component [Clostridia bacterium]
MTNANVRSSKKLDVQKLTRVAILAAIVVVLQMLPIRFGTVEINLALTPIVLGAILYGPLAGAMLGAIDGLVIILIPGTSVFLTFNFIGTIILCLLKTGLAGFIAGLLYPLLKKFDETTAVVVSALVAPVINTGIFIAGVLTIFAGLYEGVAAEAGLSLASWTVTAFITTNFMIEIIVTIIISPILIRVVKLFGKKN